MKRIPAWLSYTVLRLVFLFVPFGLLLALGVEWYWAILVATVLAFALSLLLLRKPREATATALYEAQQRRKQPAAPSDEEAAEEAYEQQQREEQARRDAEAERAKDAGLGNREG